ncbi:MAG: AMP-binding protein [Chloroflexi bacterium]|nr:AMP-binding protein [Chloroflexota bacterium]
MNTTEFLMIASAIVPERDAVVFDGKRYSFELLQERVNRLANALSDLGVAPGDRIAAMQTNCNHLIELYFAVAQLDAIYVPINFRAKEDELATMVRIVEPSFLFLGERYLPLVAGADLPARRIVMLDAPAAGGRHNYEDLLQSAEPDQMHFPEDDEDATTVIMFTSGTTSIPKGVQLTHDSFGTFLLTNVTPADPDVEETNLLTVPMYHVAGLQAALAAVFGGRTLVVMPQFDPEEWMDLAVSHRANRAMLVPTMLKHVMDHPRFPEYDLSSLDVITYGAAPMPLPVIRDAIAKFPNTRFINAFGQTETASTITMLPPDDHVLTGNPDEVETKLRRLTSIGKPLDDVEVMIVSEDGEPVSGEEVGEIVARGPRMMSGYWRQDEATGDTIRSGWLYTGDLGWQDEDGYIYLAGRARDFIKRGGEMISPEEVEQTLIEHPDVAEAAVIGVSDLEWGEEVRAVVVREGDSVNESDLIEFCRQRLAGFKRPRSVVFIDALPRNVMGKVMKRDLREQFDYPVTSNGD